MKKTIEDKTNLQDFESCISCGRKTSVKKSTPLERRDCYIWGVGQLDYTCYKRIYPEEDIANRYFPKKR